MLGFKSQAVSPWYWQYVRRSPNGPPLTCLFNCMGLGLSPRLPVRSLLLLLLHPCIVLPSDPRPPAARDGELDVRPVAFSINAVAIACAAPKKKNPHFFHNRAPSRS